MRMNTIKAVLASGAIAIACQAQTAQASVLSDAAQALQPGQWVELNTQNFSEMLYSCSSSDGFGNTILEWSNKGIWNPVNREVRFSGMGHTSRCGKHIQYKESTNTWSTGPLPPNMNDAHGYEHNAVNPLTGEYFYRHYNSNRIDVFNPNSNSWSNLPNIPTSSVQVAGAIAYFPERNGLVFVDGDFGVYFYSSGSNSWSIVANSDPGLIMDGSKPVLSMGDYHNFASYNPVDRVVYFGGGNGSNNVYVMDAQGNITQAANSPVSIGINSAMTAPDNSGRQVVFANNGTIYSYDRGSNSWRNDGSHPVMNNSIDWRIVIPVNTHGVFMVLTWGFSNSRVWLYKYSDAGGTTVDTLSPSNPSGLGAS